MVFLGASKEKVIPCCFTTVLLLAAIPIRITAITNDEALRVCCDRVPLGLVSTGQAMVREVRYVLPTTE